MDQEASSRAGGVESVLVTSPGEIKILLDAHPFRNGKAKTHNKKTAALRNFIFFLPLNAARQNQIYYNFCRGNAKSWALPNRCPLRRLSQRHLTVAG